MADFETVTVETDLLICGGLLHLDQVLLTRKSMPVAQQD